MPPLLEDLPAETGEASGFVAVLVLAVIQGLAEFLPISSSGHLAIGRSLLDMQEAGLTLDVALHVGTLGAVFFAYRKEVGELFRDLFAGRFHMILWLVLATIPVGVAGIALDEPLERAAHGTTVAGIGLLCTATFLMIGDRARRKHGKEDTEESYGTPAFKLAILLGLAQTLAICPGISRSGTTIAAGLLLGLPVLQAARYSFLMSLPAVSGAAIVKLPDAFEAGFVGTTGVQVTVAIFVAALVGLIALRTLLVATAKGAFPWFAAYCGVLGVTALAFL